MLLVTDVRSLLYIAEIQIRKSLLNPIFLLKAESKQGHPGPAPASQNSLTGCLEAVWRPCCSAKEAGFEGIITHLIFHTRKQFDQCEAG